MSRNNSNSSRGLLSTGGALVLALVAVLGVLAYVFAAPLFQPLVYDLVRDSPIIVFWWLPAVAIGLLIAVGGSIAGSENAITYAGWFVAIALIFSIVVTTPLAMMGEKEHLAERSQQKMETKVLSNDSHRLPAIDAENMRNVPMQKAMRDASNNFQKSKYQLQNPDECDITYVEGKPFWSCALVPNSGKVEWSGYQNGTALVSQTNSNSNVYIIEGDVKNGLGVKFWRSNKWNLQRHNYWYNYQDTVFMSVESIPNKTGTVKGDSNIVRPLVVNNYHVTSSPMGIWWALLVAGVIFIGGRAIGVAAFQNHPYAIGGMLLAFAVASVFLVPIAPPEFAGVAYQHMNGSVEYLSPQEVQKHPELHDDNVYPYTLAEQEIKALNWRQGLINVIWAKNSLFDLGGDASNNTYPYTVQGVDGSKDYYFTTVPNGGGDGLKHIFVMDGQNGTITQYKTGTKRLIGAQSAAGYITGQTPAGVTNWKEYKVVEVLPVPHNGQLYWMGRIVRTNSPGMAGYAFVNASAPDNDIVFAMGDNKDEKARKFASGIPITSDDTTTETKTTTTSDGSTITQIVVKQDGEVVGRYNVTSNTTIEFNVEKTNSTTTNSTG